MAPPTIGKETSFSDLGDDAVGEVLTCLLSQASLAVASAVCKPWLKICKSPAFLRHFRRQHPGAGPFLGLLHFSGHRSELRVIWDTSASSLPDLTVTLRNMEKTVGDLARFCCNLDLQVVDHHGSLCLLKPPTSGNKFFVFDLLTGQNKELRWPEEEIFFGNMTGFIIDGGNIVFVRKRASIYYCPIRAPDDDCYLYTAKNGKWRNVQPTCHEADAADYARLLRHNEVWKKRAGEVVYSLCGDFSDFTISWCLTALDTRSMSYYIVNIPRCLQHYPKLPAMTIMEMDKPGSLCLVLVAGEPLSVFAWLLQQGEGNTAIAAGEGEWKLYRKVELQGLASKLGVQLQIVHVVAAYAGVVHLRLLATAKEHQQGISYYYASLDLGSREFTNMQVQENFGCCNKVYPFFLPWCAPFLPPAGDNAEACN